MKAVANVFAAVGLLALGYWAVVFVKARIYHNQEMRRFDDTASQSQSPTKAERRSASAGSAIAVLLIPRLGLSTIVVEGADERELRLGPGHIRGTSLPGAGGNVGVAGHRDTFFRPLRFTRRNDTIQLTTHGQEFIYKVVYTEIVAPDNIQVLYPTGHETLTLVTCYPFNFVGAAPKRFVVQADCVNCVPQMAREPSR